MSDLFDKAKHLLAENADTVDDVVDKIADAVDGQTGGKHSDKIAKGADTAKGAIAQFSGADPDRPRKAEGAAKRSAKKPDPDHDA